MKKFFTPFFLKSVIICVMLVPSIQTWGQTTYYWVGATGADWNTAGNWNTAADNSGATRSTIATTDILVIDGAGITAGTATTISIPAAQSIGALRISNNTAVTLQASTTTARTITITGGTGTDLDIPSGCSLAMNHASNPVAIAFSTGTGMTGDIAGTITLGGNASNTINTTGGTGTIVTVQNTGIVNLTSTAILLVGSAATLTFADGSNCNASGATSGAPVVPLATWATTSNLTITGITSSTTAPTNAQQSFGNLTYNCSGATGTMSWFTTSTTSAVKGTLTIQSTSTGKFRCLTSGTLTVGNLVVAGGNFEVGSSGGIITVTGDLTVSGGTLDMSSTSTSTTLKVAGTVNHSSGTITESSSATSCTIEFNGTIIQNITLSALTTGAVSYKISNPLGINLTGTMSVNSGAKLTISSTASEPIAVSSTGTISYSTGTLEYTGTTNQFISDKAWPATNSPTSVTINNTGTSP